MVIEVVLQDCLGCFFELLERFAMIDVDSRVCKVVLDVLCIVGCAARKGSILVGQDEEVLGISPLLEVTPLFGNTIEAFFSLDPFLI